MFLTVRRRDKIWISLNLDHVAYFYPEAPVPADFAVIVLANGEQIRLTHSFSDFVDMVERRAGDHPVDGRSTLGSGAIRSPVPRPATPSAPTPGRR
ncbi:MAG TPA: hypothetical protein VM533_04855 [Fimbriiglobus sp.]|jgi:hypothetical protein|nr:hypothetical protein [Fimbriiglobus sp.]